jgi:multidrug resistance efflux pump
MMAGPEGDRGLVLTYLPPNGSMVKEGQMIAQIDGQAIQDHVDDLDAQVSQYALELKRLAATQLAALEVMEQRVRTYRALFDRAKQDLRALDVRNAIDQERLHLALEEAQAEYEQSRQSLELMAEQQRAERRINELVQERQVRHRDRHKRDVTQFTIHAPMSGQVVLKTLRRRGQEFQVQIGDEVAPGQQFLRVVELGPMQMDGTINQVESEAVRVGQAATLHFDAYPELVVKGRVQAVGQMATASGRLSNNYIRRIPVRIRIEDRDPRVIPDLTASADVMVAEPADGLILPREAVREEGGRSVVYVRQGDTVEPREVEVGGASNTQITVRSGIQAGEEVMVGN